MKLRIHTCKATGCQHVIVVKMLMCLDHWRMVPVEIRREVLQLAKQVRYDKAVSDAYRDAVARAVAAVEEKQERKAGEIAGASGSLFTT